jgi:hypothetical protein
MRASIAARSTSAASSAWRSVMSMNEVMAPVISPSASFNGAKFTNTGSREPSGRSMNTSTLRTGTPVRSTASIGD